MVELVKWVFVDFAYLARRATSSLIHITKVRDKLILLHNARLATALYCSLGVSQLRLGQVKGTRPLVTSAFTEFGVSFMAW